MNRAFLVIMFLIGFGPTGCCDFVDAAEVYPFQGRLNLVDRTLALAVKIADEAAVDLQATAKPEGVYEAMIDVRHLPTPLFEMTTEIQSVVTIHRKEGRMAAVTGSFWSRYSLLDHKTVPDLSGHFELNQDRLTVDQLLIGSASAQGWIDLTPPHRLNVAIAFDDIELEYFLAWLCGETQMLSGSGLLAGTVVLEGTPQRLAVKSSLTSEGGTVKSLAYDHMNLQLQGIYPLVDLANSTITKTNGFSFDLDGTVDLSDKLHMQSQLKSIKTVPLVKDTNLESEWVLKRIQDANEDDTETKYFIKKDKAVGTVGRAGNADDYEIFGVERKIGF